MVCGAPVYLRLVIVVPAVSTENAEKNFLKA